MSGDIERVDRGDGVEVKAQFVIPLNSPDGAADAVSITAPLGRKADAASVSVGISTEDAALVGALTETAPTTDTASSGLNGRLQRIAQRLTSLIGSGFTGPATATHTSVDSVTTAGGVNILASNAARRGATITNTDANGLYLYFGATGTVSSSVFDQLLLTGETLRLAPGEYTGVITGIWAADGSGAAKVCEFT